MPDKNKNFGCIVLYSTEDGLYKEELGKILLSLTKFL